MNNPTCIRVTFWGWAMVEELESFVDRTEAFACLFRYILD